MSADRLFFIFTTVSLVRAPLGGVAMGFSAVVDGLTAFRRLNAFVSSGDLFANSLNLNVCICLLGKPTRSYTHAAWIDYGPCTNIMVEFFKFPNGFCILHQYHPRGQGRRLKKIKIEVTKVTTEMTCL